MSYVSFSRPRLLALLPWFANSVDCLVGPGGAAYHHLNLINGSVRLTDKISYPLAAYTDGDTGEWCYVIPDLGIDIVRPTQLEALIARRWATSIRMAAFANCGVEPPTPSNVAALKAQTPSLSEWEWTVITVFR